MTAVCSTRNVDAVRAIGADHVLDYTKDDFARLGQRYDLILASNGDRSIWDYKRALSANGTYVMTGGSNRQLTDVLLFGPFLSMGRQKLGNLLVKPNQADLLLLKELCEAGKVKPTIDRRFLLSEVPAAVRYIEDGHARGKVVITVCGEVDFQACSIDRRSFQEAPSLTAVTKPAGLQRQSMSERS